MPYFYFDPTYFLVIIGAVICLIASARVNGTFRKYSHYRSASGMTGAQVAARILQANGLSNVEITRVSGHLTDHYDPRTQTLRLSDSVYNATSVAAIGVAAHECGHAIQHATDYAPLKWRSDLVPAANIGSMLAWPIILIGALIPSNASIGIINFGIALFSLAVIFQLVTLPVEFNASHRALGQLETLGILGSQELRMSRNVLKAAALTYVASAAAAILQLLRIILLFGGRRRD